MQPPLNALKPSAKPSTYGNHMKVRKSSQAGKGDQLRKGANLEAYWNNYDNIFRKCKPTTPYAKPSPSSPDAGTARAE
jgi:hypothetical protein